MFLVAVHLSVRFHDNLHVVEHIFSVGECLPSAYTDAENLSLMIRTSPGKET